MSPAGRALRAGATAALFALLLAPAHAADLAWRAMVCRQVLQGRPWCRSLALLAAMVMAFLTQACVLYLAAAHLAVDVTAPSFLQDTVVVSITIDYSAGSALLALAASARAATVVCLVLLHCTVAILTLICIRAPISLALASGALWTYFAIED